MAVEREIKPGQKTSFAFKPSVWVGLVFQVKEGEITNPAVVSNIHTEIVLSGIISANIVVKGGDKESFTFTLEQVKKIKA